MFTCTKGQQYVIDELLLAFAGWTAGDGSGHEGYNVSDYFDSAGFYLGADKHGIEPLFKN